MPSGDDALPDAGEVVPASCPAADEEAPFAAGRRLVESACVELAPAVSLRSGASPVWSSVGGAMLSSGGVAADIPGSVPSLESLPQAEPTAKPVAIAMHAHPRFLNIALDYHSFAGAPGL